MVYVERFLKILTTTTDKLGYNIADISGNIENVNNIFNESQFFTLSQPINTFTGYWTTGIDINILSCGYRLGQSAFMQDYQNFKFAVTYKVTSNYSGSWVANTGIFPYDKYDYTFTLGGVEDPQTIYIKILRQMDNGFCFYFIARWRRQRDSNGNPVTENLNVFEIAIFNSSTTDPNYRIGMRYVLDMTTCKANPYTTTTI